MSDYLSMGLRSNPFEATIADETSASKFTLFGREDQLARIDEFVCEAGSSEHQKRILLMGEYGTGKTHHLLRLQRAINNGDYGTGFVAVYIANIGISFRNFYEKVIAGLEEHAPALEPAIAALPDIEPGDSVESAYAPERLKENVIQNLKIVMAEVKRKGIGSIFLLIDEAEDIAQANDPTQVGYFITSLLHMINATQGSPLHLIMGFSRHALSKISGAEDRDGGQQPLGEALWQRMSGTEPIRLGYLRPSEARAMVQDRLGTVRLAPSDGVAPFVDEIIPVVTNLVSGHPREILTILNNALKDAAETGQVEVNGDVILRRLAKHLSYFTKANLLDWLELSTVIEGVAQENPAAAEEFDRLKGRLIGEGRGLAPTEFRSVETAEAMTRPISNIRLLISRYTEIGETLYYVDESVLHRIFRGRRGNSQVEQDIDRALIDLDTNPERHQPDLTRGLWRVLTETESMSFEYIERVAWDNNSMMVMIGRPPGDRDLPSVRYAVACFKGRRAPVDLFKSLVDLIAERRANFGFLLYDGPELESDNGYYNLTRALREERRDQLLDVVKAVEVRSLQRESDPRLLAKVLLMGDSEEEHEEVKAQEISAAIDLEVSLLELTEGRIIPYPGTMDRKLVEFLAIHQEQEFPMQTLKGELDYRTLTSDRLDALQRQKLIQKKGTKWQIPTLDRNPPWKLFYRHIPRTGSISFNDLAEQVQAEHFINAPEGDRNLAVQWYIGLLLKLELIAGADGAEAHFRLVDRSALVQALIPQIQSAIERTRETLSRAKELDKTVSGEEEIVRNESLLKNIREKVFDPSPADLADLRGSQTALGDLERKLNGALRDAVEAVGSEIETTGIAVTTTLEELASPEFQQLFQADELVQYRQDLDEIYLAAIQARQEERYTDAQARLREVGELLRSITETAGTRRENKRPCIEVAGETAGYLAGIESRLPSMLASGYPHSQLADEAAAIADAVEETYKPLFNEHRFSEAYSAIVPLRAQAQRLDTRTSDDLRTAESAKRRIAALAEDADDPALMSELDQATAALNAWDFAEVEQALSRFEELRGRLREREKPPDELFIENYRRAGSFNRVVQEYSVEEVFAFLKKLYDKGEIANISVSFRER